MLGAAVCVVSSSAALGPGLGMGLVLEAVEAKTSDSADPWVLWEPGRE